MKKFFLSTLSLFFILPGASLAVEFDVDDLRPVVGGSDFVRVEKNIIFDASTSFLPDPGGEADFEWDLGDGTVISGEEIVHTYGAPGSYTVTLTIRQGEEEASIAKEVFAYNKLVILLTDVAERKENILNLKEDAGEEGTFLFVLDS
ncbi:MAG: PKD domain-containing protein, partial [Candidatus Peregrinibacteria bacterium]|nr:PKD domain-containing protein [Candidatus Peregrinibacteria bacterium]